MISNIPAFTGQQDFQARHSDMLAAARCEPLTKDQVVARRNRKTFLYPKAPALLPSEVAEAKALIWESMREHLDLIGINMARPGSDPTVIVTRLPKAEWRKLNGG